MNSSTPCDFLTPAPGPARAGGAHVAATSNGGPPAGENPGAAGRLCEAAHPLRAQEFRVLIIDDTPAIHEDFRKILARPENTHLAALEAALFGEPANPPVGHLNLRLDSAYQGQEGLALVQQAAGAQRPYALAFVDIRMPPGWDGIETIPHLWAVDPELQVVICTAYSDYSWEEVTQRLGHRDNLVILKKPFDKMEVQQLAQALVEKWRLTRISKRQLEGLNAAVAQRTFQLQKANADLRQEIAERRQSEERLAAFLQLAQRLSAANSAKEAAQIIVDVADQLLGWDSCFCDLYDAEKDLVHHVLSMDEVNGERLEVPGTHYSHKPPTTMTRRALVEGGVLALSGQAENLGVPFGDFSRRSASRIYVPIRHGSRATGVLSIQSYRSGAYDQASLAVLQALADHCGGALDRVRAAEELRATQEQLRQVQKMEAIGQLAGGVAHDFNNLLAVIQGNAELALMPAITPEHARECITQITAAAGRAANLTRQLLAFSRKQVMQSQLLGLNDLIGNLGKMLKRLIGENIDLQCDFAPSLPPVQADPGMIEQVLVNLVVNARDAMPQGGQLQISTTVATLEEAALEAHPEGRAGEFVCVGVRDTGQGVAPEHLPRLFEPFFTTKPVGKGTGLGLATVYGIIKQHRGWVEVASQLGAGTTFRLYLPAAVAPVGESGAPAPKATLPGGDETILLVEDDEAVRAMTRRLLQKFGYQVYEASRAREALAVWERRRQDIDLLLTDLVMPDEMTGRDLANRLWESQPALRVVFMSGYSPDVAGRDTSFFRRRQGSCFLHKPCPSRQLLETLRRCLDEPSGL